MQAAYVTIKRTGTLNAYVIERGNKAEGSRSWELRSVAAQALREACVRRFASFEFVIRPEEQYPICRMWHALLKFPRWAEDEKKAQATESE